VCGLGVPGVLLGLTGTLPRVCSAKCGVAAQHRGATRPGPRVRIAEGLMHRGPTLRGWGCRCPSVGPARGVAKEGQPLCEHVGFAKLYGLLQRRYFWVGMWTDATRYVARCPECRKAKARHRRNPRHGIAALAEYLSHRVHIDTWDAGVASALGSIVTDCNPSLYAAYR
jgi:hypothetical protein